MRRRHNGRLMKRLMILILLAVLLVPSAAAAPEQAEADRKLINVVYDDSGSMVKSKGILIERWSQAKYALEVFCAMMGEKDVMNIFPMSKEGGLGLTLYGSDPNRVAAVHEMNGNYRNTPFKTVTAAGKNLLNAEAGYEKWLLIITDGAFDDGATPTATVQMQLEKYHEAGIKTVYLGIGDSAPVLQSNPEAGAYAEKAADGTQVLEKVTSIANQIFTHQILRDKYIAVSDSVTALSIDIPTDQIIVFAQGNDVSVGGLKLNGKEIPAAAVEHVKYSDVVPPN